MKCAETVIGILAYFAFDKQNCRLANLCLNISNLEIPRMNESILIALKGCREEREAVVELLWKVFKGVLIDWDWCLMNIKICWINYNLDLEMCIQVKLEKN